MSTAPRAPARLASGTDVSAPPVHAGRKVSASIAPSADPDDTPSVNGVASGLRSSACMTTPATASVAPTSPAASTRGRRAMKKIWASRFSAKGRDRSSTARRSIGVDPTSGAPTMAASSRTPNTA